MIISNGQVGTWAALSYCWGGASAFTLREETLAKFSQGFPLETVPATIRDAIIVTRSLGLEYLWVDALCIFQDDTHDWATEASRMSYIYKQAQITIAAALAPSSKAGIFTKRKESIISCRLPWSATRRGTAYTNIDDTKKIYLRHYRRADLEDPKYWPWSARGWTLQEDQLSWRMLIYGTGRMLWKCPSVQVDEAGHMMKPPHHLAKRYFPPEGAREGDPASSCSPPSLPLLSAQFQHRTRIDGFFSGSDLYTAWYAIIADFTRRDLTCPEDVLPALSGLASEFSSLNGDKYRAGLWEKDMICGLLWRREQFPLSYRFGDEIRRGPGDAPSWSWAGVYGGATEWFHHQKMMMREYQEDIASAREVANVIDTDIELDGLDPYGRIRRGALILEAPCYFLRKIPLSLLESEPEGSAGSPTAFFWRFISYRREVAEVHVQHPGQQFALLQMVVNTELRLKMEFLLVETIGNRRDEFRRLSWISVDGRREIDRDEMEREDQAFLRGILADEWPVKIFTLV